MPNLPITLVPNPTTKFEQNYTELLQKSQQTSQDLKALQVLFATFCLSFSYEANRAMLSAAMSGEASSLLNVPANTAKTFMAAVNAEVSAFIVMGLGQRFFGNNQLMLESATSGVSSLFTSIDGYVASGAAMVYDLAEKLIDPFKDDFADDANLSI